MSSKLTKKQKKILQHQNQIKQFDEQESKKQLAVLAQTAKQHLESINTIKKTENQLQNSQKSIESIEKSISNNPEAFQDIMKSLGLTPEQLLQEVTKPSSEEITKIKNIPSFNHIIIDKPKQQKNRYNNAQQDMKELIKEATENSKYLRINHTLSQEHLQQTKTNFLERIKANSSLYSVFSNQLSASAQYQPIQQAVIKEYTGGQYTYINQALTSDNPVEMNKMNYYLNLAIKAFKEGNVGQVFDGKQVLYRNISVPKDLLSFYKLNQFIYFTNFTSTSTENLTYFGSINDQAYAHILFQLKLLDLNSQIKANIYTGLGISQLSYYQSEKEVLILPYQIFKITKITQNGSSWTIDLTEIENKEIIHTIATPLGSLSPQQKVNTQGVKFDMDLLKKNLSQVKETLKKQQDQAFIEKKKIIEQSKEQIKKIEEKMQGIAKNSNQIQQMQQSTSQTEVYTYNEGISCGSMTAEIPQETMKSGMKTEYLYNEIAGVIGDLQQEEVDMFKNSKRGLGRDGMYSDCSIIIGCFYQNFLNDINTLVTPALKQKGYSKCQVVTSEKQFANEVQNYDQAWVISNRNMNDTNCEQQFVDSVLSHVKKLKGLMIWGDNDPYYVHANLLLKQIPVGQYQDTKIHIQLSGDDHGDKIIEAGKRNQVQKFGPHLLTTGLSQIHEGITICYPIVSSNTPKDNFGDIDVIGMSSANKPCFFALEGISSGPNKRGRIVIDCGFTKLYESYWKKAGQSLYVCNSYSWLFWKERKEQS